MQREIVQIVDKGTLEWNGKGDSDGEREEGERMKDGWKRRRRSA